MQALAPERYHPVQDFRLWHRISSQDQRWENHADQDRGYLELGKTDTNEDSKVGKSQG